MVEFLRLLTTPFQPFIGNSKERILERYERYSYAERQLVATDIETQGSWTLEDATLKARIDFLQRNQRNYMGEDLGSLSLKELQNLEHQLDSTLKSIRSRKNQLMFESISLLQKRDKALQEQNNLLTKKIKDKEKGITQQPHLEHQNYESSAYVVPQPLQSVNVGDVYQAGADGEIEKTRQQQNQANTVMPAWMLGHINR